MGLWTRETVEQKQVKASEKLCKQRDEMAEALAAAQAEWDRLDETEVLPAAAAMAAAQFMQSPGRLLACRDRLQQVIWKRDDARMAIQRKLNELQGEIEGLTGPVIMATAQRWQAELAALGGEKLVEVDEKYTDHSTDRQMVRIKSNSGAIAEARQQLMAAIRTLRGMAGRPLAEIHAHIEGVETQLRKLDLSKLVTAAEPVTQGVFNDVIGRDDPPNQQDATRWNFPFPDKTTKLLRRVP